MLRRDLLAKIPAAAAATLASAMAAPSPARAAGEAATRGGMPPLTIKDVQIIRTAPSGSNWTIVKVITSEPGLYGLGTATRQEVPAAAQAYIETRLKPFVVGKRCDDIEDIWQSAYVQQYFRSGPESNNALSGIDGALWDIMGKRLGAPVYQLLGGKTRSAVQLYGHAESTDLIKLEDQVRDYMQRGYQCVRVQLGVPEYSGYGVSDAKTSDRVQALRPPDIRGTSPVFDAEKYVTTTIKLFDHIRSTIGFDVGLVHDIHERPTPNQAIALMKAVEPYRPFYMEDPFSPDDVGWFKTLRQETSCAVSMGELFVNKNEWLSLVANREIDYIRCHQSAMGGLNMCRKIAHTCEMFGVRTAWHGPNNVDPVGHCYNVHLDLASPNFGIQEETDFDEKTREVFPGCPEVKGGYMFANNKPGWGIDIDEKAAARYPYKRPYSERGNDRFLDGGIVRP